MRAAGVRQLAAAVEALELPAARALRPDEVLIEVQASGVGNWDEIARTGGWDLGARPPLALGVEAAGLARVVPGAGRLAVTHEIRTHGPSRRRVAGRTRRLWGG